MPPRKLPTVAHFINRMFVMDQAQEESIPECYQTVYRLSAGSKVLTKPLRNTNKKNAIQPES
jgi:hypothetical protein